MRLQASYQGRTGVHSRTAAQWGVVPGPAALPRRGVAYPFPTRFMRWCIVGFLLSLVGGCAALSRTTHLIEENQTAVEASTKSIRGNSEAVEGSIESIRGNNEGVEASTRSIHRNSQTVDESTDAIQRNRLAVEESTAAIERSRRVTERMTSLMERFTPGHEQFWVLLVLLSVVGATLVAFFVLVITALRIRRSLRRLEREASRIGRVRP